MNSTALFLNKSIPVKKICAYYINVKYIICCTFSSNFSNNFFVYNVRVFMQQITEIKPLFKKN